MPRLGTILLCGGLFAVWGGIAAGQSMIEHMAAATGGSAAGVAGKQVSDGLDKVFGKLGKTMEKADVPEKKEVKTKAAAAEPGPSTARAPVVRRDRHPQPIRQAPDPAPEPEAMPVILRQAIPEPPRVTPAQIAQVQTGAERQEVLAKLGRPSARVTIPEDGRLLEIYQYSAKGRVIGSLRMTDGVVSSVRVDQR